MQKFNFFEIFFEIFWNISKKLKKYSKSSFHVSISSVFSAHPSFLSIYGLSSLLGHPHNTLPLIVLTLSSQLKSPFGERRKTFLGSPHATASLVSVYLHLHISFPNHIIFSQTHYIYFPIISQLLHLFPTAIKYPFLVLTIL